MRHLAPLLLRIALGVTFVWAGWGKLFSEAAYTPEQAAALANMGVSGAQKAAGQPSEMLTPPAETEAPAADAPLPEPRSDAGFRVILAQNAVEAPSAEEFRYTAEEFAGPVTLARRHHIALILHNAAHPPEGERRAWPQALGSGVWPNLLAWAVGLSELALGALVLIGLVTRLAALGIAIVMATALWLVAIAPALSSPDAFLGFLPPLAGFSPGAWTPFLFKLTLCFAALSVLISGPGAISFDRFLSRRTARRSASSNTGDDEDDDE